MLTKLLTIERKETKSNVVFVLKTQNDYIAIAQSAEIIASLCKVSMHTARSGYQQLTIPTDELHAIKRTLKQNGYIINTLEYYDNG